ncbi:hypothetical protein E4U54_006289 [Claviceps lovelessii]|nr:hypothetical protein E4U54_006289 [Claviceps lovelessii]
MQSTMQSTMQPPMQPPMHHVQQLQSSNSKPFQTLPCLIRHNGSSFSNCIRGRPPHAIMPSWATGLAEP